MRRLGGVTEKTYKILHDMRKRSFENASSFLDERRNETERLQDGQMFKAVHLLQRHSKLTVHDQFKYVITGKHKVSSTIAKHFETQFQDVVDMFVSRQTRLIPQLLTQP